MKRKKSDFNPTDPKWGGTMKDVRDALARGEGLSSEPYPYGNKPLDQKGTQETPTEKRKGCLGWLIGFGR